MKLRILAILPLLAAALSAQPQQVLPNPDCQFYFTLTTSGTFLPTGNGFDNRQQGCTVWNFSYVNSGFSGLTVTLQSAANNAGSAGSWGTGFAVQQSTISGSNAATNTTAGFWWAEGTNAFVRVILSGTTGSGVVNGAVFGWRQPGAVGGTPGAITCLTGDVTAGSGSGCLTATVVGLESVPFCTGYTPTNGEFVQYTTGSSPNPCYTAAAASSTTGNAASIVTYTPGASVTLTCPSSSAGTVTEFDPGGTALAANMALSYSTCKAGQIVTVRVIQAASGGPYTVSGLPTGSPQISTYPSATTVYTLQAATSSTMTFVNVAAIGGSSSLGAGANGISRTVTAGSSGVNAGFLAAKDASNPTDYNTAGSAGCGSGVAAYSATSGNTFELYTVPGTVLSMVADNAITAGHLLTGGTGTPGRVADTGQTARTAIALSMCIVGVALQSQGSAGGAVLVAYDGTGVYGALGNSGTVTSVSFTGGIISVATATTTPALTVAGTSGGLVYFSSASTWASSGAMASGQFVLGGGAGSAPTTSFSVVPIANGGTNASSAAAGTVPNATSSSAASWTAAVILGVDNTTAGTLQLANAGAAFHTIWGSAATANNSILGFTAVPTNGHLVTCTVSGTTCTLTDGGAVPSQVYPSAGIPNSTGSAWTTTPPWTIPYAPTASANYGTISLGSGPFDGSTTGKFVGSSAGTQFAINAASGSTADLANWQVAGVTKFSVTATGNLTIPVVTLGGTVFANSSEGWITGGAVMPPAGWRGQGLELANNYPISWSSTTSPDSGSYDTKISRLSAGVISVDSTSAGNSLGGLVLASTRISTSVAVGSLPSCASGTLLQRQGVNDATLATPGSTAVGGGTYTIAVQCTFNTTGSAYTWIID